MRLVWEGNQPLADREMVAALYEVSVRTVRRHCRPVRYEPAAGQPRGENGVALYDALAAAEQLAGVAPRPGKTVAALTYRIRRNLERERAGAA